MALPVLCTTLPKLAFDWNLTARYAQVIQFWFTVSSPSYLYIAPIPTSSSASKTQYTYKNRKSFSTRLVSDFLITRTLRALHILHLLLTLPLLLFLPLPPILRHPRQPIQSHRRHSINSDIHPDNAEIPPPPTITTTDLREERIRALYGAEITRVGCVGVENVAAVRIDPGGHVSAAGLA